MKFTLIPVFSFLLCGVAADSNTTARSSQDILPDSFEPPQVWNNLNLLRNINLEKGYAKETVNIVIHNKGGAPQDKYYLPFEAGMTSRIGGFEVRDKKHASGPAFRTEVVKYGGNRPTEYYLIHLPKLVSPAEQLTLNMKYHVLDQLHPLPTSIPQTGSQYIQYSFSAYLPSAYETFSQKTKLKLPTANILNITGPEPTREGRTLTYGPFSKHLEPGANLPSSLRYEYTHPILAVTQLERDIEVSHWGGNLATEERYILTNAAANLSEPFSRVDWQTKQYYNPVSTALRSLPYPLKAGSVSPYFTDDIGNVSTSHFRPSFGSRDAYLELTPRYPVFGGWKYKFRVGWDAQLDLFLRQVSASDKQASYVLNVPFLEGPKMGEGISYERVEVRVLLPEGAKNVKYETSMPIVSEELSLVKTYMDTVGRTTLKLTALNVIDEDRDNTLIVTYDYSLAAMLRKPLTVFGGMMCVFIAAWALSCVDTSIGGKKK